MLTTRRGMSLVELLIVVAIIGLLLQLALPAVEMSREKARGTSCQSNLKQLGLAAQIHLDTHRHFPAGGWGWRWVGDPDRGFDEKQPGGWAFNVLPYIEESALHDLGRGESEPAKKQAAMQQSEKVVAIFICPSRRLASTFPNHAESDYFNSDTAERFAKCDYAANAGDYGCCDRLTNRDGPPSLAAGDEAQFEPPLNDDGSEPESSGGFVWSRIANEGTGMVFLRSTIRPAGVTDGLSHTYLFGEKYLEPVDYRTGTSPGDDQSWNVGFDKDIYRWTDWGEGMVPQQDTLGDANVHRFGSSHPMSMNFVFADGSIRTISYSIDEETHSQLGNRHDGRVVKYAEGQL
jgi:prepilin-type N-terminal cleavage/methylation domain-containing protein